MGTGFLCGAKIADMVEAGFDFTIFLADWHAWINNKLGGVMENIRLCGAYLKEGFAALGLTPSRVRFLWASELVARERYWENVLRVAKKATLSRVIRCLPIMGRALNPADVDAASLIYPSMQVADIFELGVDCACAGLDQRKAHMLARDVAEKLHLKKPVCLHTHLLPSLAGPSSRMGGVYDEDEALNLQISSKMSKSIPRSCIYIHDSPEDIRAKLMEAYCPPKQAAGNPVMEIARYVVFAKQKVLRLERKEKFGGPVDVEGYPQLEALYAAGKIHPLDLKNGVAEALIKILEPVRRHFKGKEDLLQRMVELEKAFR
ncbi:tyrosine--tRNA ligase [Candidatus Hecatella orcuttiae]|uniref:tyrosine--tRNA ligase n=1 Tax=Candidatus Hecatella orcuttiae TaxID=1935119 RepID=UPI00286817FC|nr:tyrosine--tRNA ligase [Candidatus Hecatella orcuttiae]